MPDPRPALAVLLLTWSSASAQTACEFQKLELGPPAAMWYYPAPGRSVDIDGERVVVAGQSRAHVFELQGGQWAAVAELLPPQPSASFGRCVAISGDVLVVGAPEDPAHGSRSGAVVVYERQAGQWLEIGTLFASDAGQDRLFGASLALEGDLLVVGAPGHGNTPGSAYVFERSGGGLPTETAELHSGTGYGRDDFGISVATHGGAVVVGDSDYWAQFVRVYERGGPGGSTWTPTAEITANGLQPEDQFGFAVAIWGDTLVVGAPMHRFQGHWYYPGAAFVYEREAGDWVFRRKLQEPKHYYERGLGASVAIEGDVILVGAPGTDYPWGWDDDVYVFRRIASSGVWPAHAQTLFSGDQVKDDFGAGVAISNGRAIIGAPSDRDAAGEVVGAAYLTCLDALGTVLCDNGDDRTLRLTGSAVAADNALVLTVRNGWGRGYFLMGNGTGVVNLPGPGNLCLAGGPSGVLRIDQPMLDPADQLELALDLTAIDALPGGVLAGQTWRFQAWWWEFYAQQGAFSNAVSVTFQ